MEKVDLKKQLKEFYQPGSKEVSELTIPKMNFLMIDGKGDPTVNKDFQTAIEKLYSLSYTLKFDIKKSREIDYPVMALEGLWWAEDMADFISGNRENWKWTLMIMQPDQFVTKDLVAKAFETVTKKKGFDLSNVRFESFEEGRSAQLMHIGPFSEEGPNIQKIHDYIKASGGEMYGKHHEIYLSDFRRVAPEKMKTILRQPFK